MPVLAGGRALLNELHANDGDLCKIFGVINAGPEIARERAESAGGRFTIVPDPNRHIIAGYDAKRSVCTTLASSPRTIVTTYPGRCSPTHCRQNCRAQRRACAGGSL